MSARVVTGDDARCEPHEGGIVAPCSRFSNLAGNLDPMPVRQMPPGTTPAARLLVSSGGRRAALVDILVVCTANLVRSPLLAALLRREADRRVGVGRVTVESAGIDAPLGEPPPVGSRLVAERLGVSLDDHRSRPLRHLRPAQTGVILTMTRRQRRLIARTADVAERTFAVRELVPILEGLQSDGGLAEPAEAATGASERIASVVATAHAHRRRRFRRRGLDVPDPIRGGEEAFRTVGEELDAAAGVLADAFFGPVPD
jgi:protein-tyrosine-phosphatase